MANIDHYIPGKTAKTRQKDQLKHKAASENENESK